VKPQATHVGLREAAELLGVHYMTVYRYARTGRLPAERVGAAWRVATADLERFRTPHDLATATRDPQPRRPARLLDRMTAGDEAGSWSIVEEALTSGATANEVYVDLLVPALRTIGTRWEQGQLSVAAEHRASAVATRIVGRLGPMFARRGLSRGAVVLGAPEGDLHALPCAIVADILRGRGFEVLDLGANTPVGSFVESAQGTNRLIAIIVGVSSVDSLKRLPEIAIAVRAAAPATPLLFGGGAIGDQSRAIHLGADGWSGAHASSVVDAVEEIASRSTS